MHNSNPDIIADQKAFQAAFGHGIIPYPQIPSERVQERRRMLVTEEFNSEFLTAWEACNNLGRLPADDPARKELEAEALAELADSLADAIYVLIGTAFEYGLPLAEVWRAVQEANMSKLWTSDELSKVPREEGYTSKATVIPGSTTSPPLSRYVVYNRAGKVMKPPSWKAPDIKGIIQRAIANAQTPPDQAARREKWKEALSETDAPQT